MLSDYHNGGSKIERDNYIIAVHSYRSLSVTANR